jgi:hypothetical protein
VVGFFALPSIGYLGDQGKFSFVDARNAAPSVIARDAPLHARPRMPSTLLTCCSALPPAMLLAQGDCMTHKR